MSVSEAFCDYVMELLAPLGTVRRKRMFSGAGLYLDEQIFALILDDVLYLKTDTQNRSEFEAAGCAPFAYDSSGKTVVTSYWRAPDEAMDSPALMQPWARSALAAALRTKAPKSPKPPKPATHKPRSRK